MSGATRWRPRSSALSAARARSAGSRSRRSMAPDEEGGELNIVPFLDIIMNVLMFVLATVAVTFTATIDTTPPRSAGSGVRAPTHEQRAEPHRARRHRRLLAQGVGRQRRAGLQRRRAPASPFPKASGDYDYAALTACAKKLKDALGRVQGRDAGDHHRQPAASTYQTSSSTPSTRSATRRTARTSSPTFTSGCAR